MNTHALAKHYGALTPRERLPLLVAARLRHDDAEEDRLLHRGHAGELCAAGSEGGGVGGPQLAFFAHRVLVSEWARRRI
jgi:hypothetical protein